MKAKDIEKRWEKGYDFTNEDDMRQMGNDIEWLIDQAVKVERYEKSLKFIAEHNVLSMNISQMDIKNLAIETLK